MEHTVKAVVLAAGKGTRLRTEGIDLPKVLRQAAGRPLLGYVLEELSFLSGRFPYELVCCVGKRVPRTYIRRGKKAGGPDME